MEQIFQGFPKIPRLNREMIITEKIDGTNALISITENGTFQVGSRTQWISPENDNYGFARWAYENKEELLKLGPGRHFGEWWGCGIQRNYGLKEKRFSLFNTYRWIDDNLRPKCCHVVPILYSGLFNSLQIDITLDKLKDEGSVASPNFMKPEGIIIYHSASKNYFKVTCEKDEKPKGSQE